MAKYTPPGGNRNKKVKTHKSTATMKPRTGAAAARSRSMVMNLASVTPVGRLSKAVSAITKASRPLTKGGKASSEFNEALAALRSANDEISKSLRAARADTRKALAKPEPSKETLRSAPRPPADDPFTRPRYVIQKRRYTRNARGK